MTNIFLSVSIVPCRIVSALMCFLAIALAYMLRISLSYAITQMVIRPHHGNGTTIQHPDVCPPYDDEISFDHKQPISSDFNERYNWSQELQGLILSSFYWVIARTLYMLFHFSFIKQTVSSFFSSFSGIYFDTCAR